MRKYKKIQIMVEKEVAEKIICDECGTDISSTPIDYYFEVETSHGNWGSSSIESVKDKDFCSPKCLNVDFQRYYEKPQPTEQYQIECIRKSK